MEYTESIVDDITTHVGQAMISAKDRRNVSTAKILDLSNADMFLQPANVIFLANQLYVLYRASVDLIARRLQRQQGKSFKMEDIDVDTLQDIHQKVSVMAREWAYNRRLNDQKAKASWMKGESLHAFNDMFIEEVRSKFESASMNVASAPAAPTVDKLGKDLLAADYAKLRFGSARPFYITDDMQRYKNAIPFWERYLYKKNYDPVQEDSHLSNPESASIITPIYKFDMRKVRATCGKFDKYRCN